MALVRWLLLTISCHADLKTFFCNIDLKCNNLSHTSPIVAFRCFLISQLFLCKYIYILNKISWVALLAAHVYPRSKIYYIEEFFHSYFCIHILHRFCVWSAGLAEQTDAFSTHGTEAEKVSIPNRKLHRTTSYH